MIKILKTIRLKSYSTHLSHSIQRFGKQQGDLTVLELGAKLCGIRNHSSNPKRELQCKRQFCSCIDTFHL